MSSVLEETCFWRLSMSFSEAASLFERLVIDVILPLIDIAKDIWMLVIIANRIFGRSFSNRARSAGAADHGRVLPNDDGAFFAATYLPGYGYLLTFIP